MDATRADGTAHHTGLPRGVRRAGWAIIVALLYLHLFVRVANTPGVHSIWIAGPAWWLFIGACSVALVGGPIWVLVSIAYAFQWRAGRGIVALDGALFTAVLGLMGLYAMLQD